MYRYLGLRFVLFVVIAFYSSSLTAQINSIHKEHALQYRATKVFPENANKDSVLTELIKIYYEHSANGEEEKLAKDVIYIGYLFSLKPDNLSAIRWFNILIKSKDDLLPEDSFDVIYHTRDVYLKIKAYDMALEQHLRLKPYYTRLNDYMASVDYATVVAKIYLGLNNFKRAIESYRNCANLAQRLEYSHLESMMYNDIGICYEKQNIPDSSIFYYRKAVETLKSKVLINSTALYDSFSLALIEGNIAQVQFTQLGEFEGVLEALQKDLRFSKRIKDKENIIHTYNHLAKFYFKTKDYVNAIEQANRAIFRSNKEDILANSVVSHENKGNCFLKLNRFDSAAYCFKKAAMLTDSLNLEKSNMQIAAMEVVYGLKEKDEKLKQQIEIRKAATTELDRRLGQNQKILIVLVLLSLSLVLLYYAYFKRRVREKQLQLVYNEIEAQKEIIEQTLTQKESLLKEIHHRVKNNLQVISSLFELQALRTSNDDVKKAIMEGQNRVKSMALIHQKLYQTEELKNLPFKSYIDDLVSTLIQSYGKTEKDINYNISCDQVRFELDISIPIGLITNELVSNSIKYAFRNIKEPTITVVLRKLDDDFYLLKISDNGHGLPKDFDPEKLDSLGIKLIRTLARQIGADWSLTGTNGTVFIMKFKAN